MRKPAFCICENKDTDQLRAKLISAFVFATRITQSLYFLNPKFQASSHFLRLYSPVCVGPGRKPQRPVFSQRGSIFMVCFREEDSDKSPQPGKIVIAHFKDTVFALFNAGCA